MAASPAPQPTDVRKTLVQSRVGLGEEVTSDAECGLGNEGIFPSSWV
jgi:hypothetical protein